MAQTALLEGDSQNAPRVGKERASLTTHRQGKPGRRPERSLRMPDRSPFMRAVPR
jgi:hypothetical protein